MLKYLKTALKNIAAAYGVPWEVIEIVGPEEIRDFLAEFPEALSSIMRGLKDYYAEGGLENIRAKRGWILIDMDHLKALL